ncbi:MAG: hypothetical protein ACOC1F_14775, partial [Myxococcota bacterium]
MASQRTRDLSALGGQVDSRGDVIELTDLDYDELPPTDPVPVLPNRPRIQPLGECIDLRDLIPPRLSPPVCVEFDDDRAQDSTPPPVSVRESLTPISASPYRAADDR